MKRATLFLSVAAVATIIVFQSCKKAVDVFHTIDPCCRIEHMVLYEHYFNKPRHWDFDFTYDAAGRPVSVIPPGAAEAGVLLCSFFSYDRFGRVTGFMQNYQPNSSFLIWKKYVYAADGRTVYDTLFTYGDGWPGNRPSSYIGALPGYLKLDAFGRIVEEYQRYGTDQPFSLVARYIYNSAGDLVKVDDPNRPFTYGAYDDKVSFRRTHPTWMFVDRNFSLHNAVKFVGTGYNARGLPMTLVYYPETIGLINNTFLDMSYDSVHVTYSCRP